MDIDFERGADFYLRSKHRNKSNRRKFRVKPLIFRPTLFAFATKGEIVLSLSIAAAFEGFDPGICCVSIRRPERRVSTATQIELKSIKVARESHPSGFSCSEADAHPSALLGPAFMS